MREITENGEPVNGARFEITVPKGAYRYTGTGDNKPEKYRVPVSIRRHIFL